MKRIQVAYILIAAVSTFTLEGTPFIIHRKEEVPDLPSEGGFSYDFQAPTASVSGAFDSTMTLR